MLNHSLKKLWIWWTACTLRRNSVHAVCNRGFVWSLGSAGWLLNHYKARSGSAWLETCMCLSCTSSTNLLPRGIAQYEIKIWLLFCLASVHGTRFQKGEVNLFIFLQVKTKWLGLKLGNWIIQWYYCSSEKRILKMKNNTSRSLTTMCPQILLLRFLSNLWVSGGSGGGINLSDQSKGGRTFTFRFSILVEADPSLTVFKSIPPNKRLHCSITDEGTPPYL